MKKFLIWVLALFIVFAVAGIIFYKVYLPGLVAEAIAEDQTPGYVPRFVEVRMKKYKAPLNKGAGDVIREIHESNVSLEQVLQAIDRTEPEQVHAALDELGNSNPKTTDEVFDIASKYVNADFNVEILRKPFNENVNMSMVKRAMGYAEGYRNDDTIDPEMAKAVAKKLLIQKEKEYRQSMMQE